MSVHKKIGCPICPLSGLALNLLYFTTACSQVGRSSRLHHSAALCRRRRPEKSKLGIDKEKRRTPICARRRRSDGRSAVNSRAILKLAAGCKTNYSTISSHSQVFPAPWWRDLTAQEALHRPNDVAPIEKQWILYQ